MSARKKFSPAVVTYVPEQGKHLTTLDRLEKEFKITFEFIVQSLPGDWGSMLRLTTTDNNCCHDGDRIPGLWIYKDSKLRVDFYSSKNNEFNHNIKTAEWYSIEISQTAINDKLLMHNYRIKLNEIIIHEAINSQASLFSTETLYQRPIFSADGWKNSKSEDFQRNPRRLWQRAVQPRQIDPKEKQVGDQIGPPGAGIHRFFRDVHQYSPS